MKLQHLLLLVFFCAANGRADVVQLGALKDTMIQNRNPNNADGGGAGLFVGDDGDSFKHRALIAFDLSSIPAGSIITNVQLTLTLGQVAGSGGGGCGMGATSATISLYSLARDWGEGTAGNPSESTGLQMSGGGYMAAIGDATWNAAFNGQTMWSVAGGDYSSTASTTLFLDNTTVGTPFTWPSTPQLVADVRGWLNNPSSNFGWELINADETSQRTFFAFFSREWGGFPGGHASQEPVLQITYTPPVQVPVSASAPLWALAAVSILSLRALHRRA